MLFARIAGQDFSREQHADHSNLTVDSKAFELWRKFKGPLELSVSTSSIDLVQGFSGSLDSISLSAAPQDVRLRFLFFGPSMPTYVPSWLEPLPDVPRNEMRGDGMVGGGEDAGELRREERGEDRRDDEGDIGEGGLERSGT
ncbi:hypothetical protein ACEPPN_015184 [Leptodophora sp. 'Broadleaf-Isolate-01']